jgi:hypothetical protein
MLLDFRKPHCAIVEWCISWSGKYYCFLGSHYHEGHTCWVLGTSNKMNGEIKELHYNTKFGSIEPKAQCETTWRQFKEKMLAKPESELSEDAHIPRPWERQN